MTTKKSIVLVFATACVALTAGCKRPNNIQMVANSGLGKPFPLMHDGDKIEWWSDQTQSRVNVIFPFVTPCNGVAAGQPTNTCTVQVPKEQNGMRATYGYFCPDGGCADPEVPVGPSYGDGGPGPRGKTLTGMASNIELFCQSNQVVYFPASPQPAHVNQPFTWLVQGNPQNLWTVRFDNPAACKESQPLGTEAGDNAQACTPAQAGDYTYTAHVNMCTTDATGIILHVMP